MALRPRPWLLGGLFVGALALGKVVSCGDDPAELLPPPSPPPSVPLDGGIARGNMIGRGQPASAASLPDAGLVDRAATDRPLADRTADVLDAGLDVAIPDVFVGDVPFSDALMPERRQPRR